jgi:hypothetical protein
VQSNGGVKMQDKVFMYKACYDELIRRGEKVDLDRFEIIEPMPEELLYPRDIEQPKTMNLKFDKRGRLRKAWN